MKARVSVRPATKADLPKVEDWYAEAAKIAHSDVSLQERFAAKGKGRALLAIEDSDGQAIGIADCRTSFPAKGWLAVDFIALATGKRGWGYGSEAVRQIEAEHPGSRFLAEIDQRIGLALYFWLRLGYRPASVNEIVWRAPVGDGIIAMVRDTPARRI